MISSPGHRRITWDDPRDLRDYQVRRTAKFTPIVCALMMLPFAAACQGTADLDPTIGNAVDTERPVVPTSPASGTRLALGELPSGATYLTDSTERPLYAKVEVGEDCDVVCESVWPPVGATSPPAEAAVPAVLPTLVGTVLREDGRLQVTYSGRPLHYRVGPDSPLVPRARVNDRWGEWALMAPAGAPLEP